MDKKYILPLILAGAMSAFLAACGNDIPIKGELFNNRPSDNAEDAAGTTPEIENAEDTNSEEPLPDLSENISSLDENTAQTDISGISAKPIGELEIKHPDIPNCFLCNLIPVNPIGETQHALTGDMAGPFTYNGPRSKNPDAAYDYINDHYIVVWEEDEGKGTTNIYAKLLAGDGKTVIVDKKAISSRRNKQGCLYKNFGKDNPGITAPTHCLENTDPAVTFNNGVFFIAWTLKIKAPFPAAFPFSVIIGKMVDPDGLKPIDSNWDEGIMLSKAVFTSSDPSRPASSNKEIMSWATHRNPALAPTLHDRSFLVAWETNRDFVNCADPARWNSSSIYGRIITTGFSPDGENLDLFPIFTDPSTLNSTTCARPADVISARNAQAAYNSENKNFAAVFEFSRTYKGANTAIGGKIITIDNNRRTSVVQPNQIGEVLLERAGHNYANPDVTAAGRDYVLASDFDNKNVTASKLVDHVNVLRRSGDPQTVDIGNAFAVRPRIVSNAVEADTSHPDRSRAGREPGFMVSYEKRSSSDDMNAQIGTVVIDNRFSRTGDPVVISGGAADKNTRPETATAGRKYLTVWMGESGDLSTIYGTLVKTEPENQRPTARVKVTSGSSTVFEGSSVTLSAIESNDPEDGVNLAYRWQRVSGPLPADLSQTDRREISFTAPNVDNTEVITFRLKVVDTEGLESLPVDQTITIEPVSAPNQRPTAVITVVGGSSDVPEGSRVILSATGSSDPEDGTLLTYRWEHSGGPMPVNMTGAETGELSFTAPDVNTSTNITIRLTVSDTEGLTSDPAEQTIIVRNNRRPIAHIEVVGGLAMANEGGSITLSAAGSSDPEDGENLTYLWQHIEGPAPLSFNGVTGREASLIAPNVSSPQTIVIQLTVFDQSGLSSNPARQNISINRRPVAQITFVGGARIINEGSEVTLSAAGSSDPEDGGSLTYLWEHTGGPSPTFISGTNGNNVVFRISDVQNTQNTVIRLTVFDSNGFASGPVIQSIQINRRPVARITVTGGNSGVANEGGHVTLSASGSYDPEGARIPAFEWRHAGGPAPLNLTGTNSAELSFDVPLVSERGVMQFELIVSDIKGLASVPAIQNITINRRPVAAIDVVGGSSIFYGGMEVVLSGGGSSDPEDNAITTYLWEHVSGPAPVNLRGTNSQTARFNTPEVTGEEIITIRLTVSDSRNFTSLPVTKNITVRVNQKPTAAIVVSGGASTVYESEGVTLSATGSSDPEDGGTLTYLWEHVSGPAPQNLTGANTSSVSFTAPDVTGTADITLQLTVFDTQGLASDPARQAITVRENQKPTAVIEVMNGSPVVNEGNPVNLSAAGSSDPEDGSNLIYLWEHVSGPVPVNFTGTTGETATFNAPDVANATDILIRLTVFDTRNLASDSVTQTITVNPIIPDNNKPVASIAFVTGGTTVAETGGSPDYTPINITLSGTASNDGDPDVTQALVYQWSQIEAGSNNAIVNPIQYGAAGEIFNFTVPDVTPADSAGGLTVKIQLIVDDGQAQNSASDPVVVEIHVTFVNRPPWMDLGADREVTEGTSVTITSDSGDPDQGQPLTYTWLQIDSTGIAVSFSEQGTGNINFTAPRVANDITLRFRATLSDTIASASDEISIKVLNENRPPSAPVLLKPSNGETLAPTRAYLEWQASTDPDVSEGDSVSYDVYVSNNPDNFGIVYPLCMSVTRTSCVVVDDPSMGQFLIPNSIYYWKVVVKDTYGASATSATWSFTADNSAVAVWKFDDGDSGLCPGDAPALAGTRTCDSSGNNYHGVFSVANAGPSWIYNGDAFLGMGILRPIDLALGFNADGYVKIPSINMSGWTRGTFEFWINVDRFTNDYEHNLFLSRGIGGPDNYKVYIALPGNSRTVQFALYNGSYSLVNSQQTVGVRGWKHITCRFGPGGLSIYINGELANSNTKVVALQTFAGEAMIGGHNYGVFGDFFGAIDEVMVYNKVLSADEIKNNFRAGNALLNR